MNFWLILMGGLALWILFSFIYMIEDHSIWWWDKIVKYEWASRIDDFITNSGMWLLVSWMLWGFILTLLAQAAANGEIWGYFYLE